MFDFVSVLKANPVGVMATQDEQSVKTRILQFLFADGNKAYFCTSSKKPVYAQLKKNQSVSFCAHPADFTPVVSINGKAVFSDDKALKARVLEENPMIKYIYNNPDNPVFKLFYVDVKKVETFSFTEGSKTYNF